MTDLSPGPGWWLASDGNWYPPHLHPDARAAAAMAARNDGPQSHAASVAPSTPSGHAAPSHAAPSHAAPSGAPAGATSPGPELLASFGVPTGDASLAPTRTLPVAGTAASDGTIDWDAVARERAEQRKARQQREASRRRLVLLAGGALVIVGAVVAALFVLGDDDPAAPPATTASAPSTTARPSTTSASSATAAPTTGGTISVFSLQPGSCIDQDNLTTGLVTSVRTVPCTEPHTHEAYHRATVTPVDAPYDAAKVTDFANKACTDGFTTYVGVPYEQSKYYYVHLAPSAESWNKNRDRDVVCLLLLEGQKLTSSVKGKGE